MATFAIRESVPLDLPPERVFPLLLDPERVVVCLPGAALEARDGDEMRGSMTVQVGAVRVAYQGRAAFEEIDEDGRRVRLTGSGRERSGSGAARMTMTGTVEAREGGGCTLVVDAEVDVSGRMVRFGRGMIERVAAELFKDFTACLSGLAGQGGGQDEAGGAEEAGVDQLAAAAGGAPTPAVEGELGKGPAPLHALPLLFRALRSALARWLRRLTGRGSG